MTSGSNVQRRRGSVSPILPLLAGAAMLAQAAGCSRSGDGATQKPALVVGSLGKTPGRLYLPRALAVDPASGAFYVADRSGRILHFDGSGRPSGEWRLPASQNGQPVGLAIERGGSLLVNDSHYHRILRYSPDGSEILARWGTEGTGPGQFTYGRDVVVDSEGAVYAGDYGGGNDRIEKFAEDGRFILEWGGCGEEPGKLRRPQGMAVDRARGEETILVADCCNHRIQRFTRGGRWVSSFGHLGVGVGEMRYPMSVAVRADGTVLVCEWGNHRIQAFDPSGRSLGILGRSGREPGEFAHPWDVDLGPGDSVYVADCENHRVQVFRWAPRAVAAAVEARRAWNPAPGPPSIREGAGASAASVDAEEGGAHRRPGGHGARGT